jgi:hypothetical protein
MYRTAGSTVVIELMLKEHVKKADDKRRLDIAATYGEWQALPGGHLGFSHSDQKDRHDGNGQ